MTKEDCAYIAAFLDTDGWIIVVPTNKGKTYESHTVRVGLVNRHKEVLEWVREIFGGQLVARKRNRMSPHAKNWSETYDLNFRSEEIAPLLGCVYPYLKIKKEQAAICLEILGTKGRKGQWFVTPEVRQRRLELYKRVRELNWVGIDRSGLESI